MMIGVFFGGYEIFGIQSVGLVINFFWNFFDLEFGVRYYFLVEVVNFVGQFIKFILDGIIIDFILLEVGIVFIIKFYYNERWFKEVLKISVFWEGFIDFELFIDYYIFLVVDVD